jgi:hypothetical protein
MTPGISSKRFSFALIVMIVTFMLAVSGMVWSQIAVTPSGAGTSASTTVTVDANYTLVANFTAARGMVTGTVTLDDLPSAVSATTIPVTVSLSPDGGGTWTDHSVSLDGDDVFSIGDVAAGTYRVKVKASHWASQTNIDITVAAGGSANAGAFLLANGDVNGDDDVDASDIDALFTAVHEGSPDTATYDLNASGAVDTNDVKYLVEAILDTYYGDADLDGAVGVADMSLLAGSCNHASDAGWANGDFDGDGVAGVSDLSVLAANYNLGSRSTLNWADAYAQTFGTTTELTDDFETVSADSEESTDDTLTDAVSSSACSSLGLSLIAVISLMGLMFVKLEK